MVPTRVHLACCPAGPLMLATGTYGRIVVSLAIHPACLEAAAPHVGSLPLPPLLVFVDGSASEDDARACREFFEALRLRHWRYAPPVVDRVDDVPVTSPHDLPSLRTVGLGVTLPEPEDTDDEECGSA